MYFYRPKQAIGGEENITILSTNNDIWQYKIYEKQWKRVSNFILNCDEGEKEFVTKIAGWKCISALTNLGKLITHRN